MRGSRRHPRHPDAPRRRTVRARRGGCHSTAGGGVGARRKAMSRGAMMAKGVGGGGAARWRSPPPGRAPPLAEHCPFPLGVAARVRATGGRPASVGPGSPVSRTPTPNPTTHPLGRDGSARFAPAQAHGRPSRRPCGRRGGCVPSRLAWPLGCDRVGATHPTSSHWRGTRTLSTPPLVRVPSRQRGATAGAQSRWPPPARRAKRVCRVVGRGGAQRLAQAAGGRRQETCIASLCGATRRAPCPPAVVVGPLRWWLGGLVGGPSKPQRAVGGRCATATTGGGSSRPIPLLPPLPGAHALPAWERWWLVLGAGQTADAARGAPAVAPHTAPGRIRRSGAAWRARRCADGCVQEAPPAGITEQQTAHPFTHSQSAASDYCLRPTSRPPRLPNLQRAASWAHHPPPPPPPSWSCPSPSSRPSRSRCSPSCRWPPCRPPTLLSPSRRHLTPRLCTLRACRAPMRSPPSPPSPPIHITGGITRATATSSVARSPFTSWPRPLTSVTSRRPSPTVPRPTQAIAAPCRTTASRPSAPGGGSARATSARRS
ncbi:hypothetical protein BU14_0283s0012 [Porphyra umbilicalis]|uniref:Uncharacterized protein n=1 Tax=Porphyra umbilicalis TaxID=2786 RepID=A0A1X6P1F3_PORUM|nr:hypothetical protein BU14_0283s0012 [Porphyra umbilicalis]|eukprot:OSX74580.1 hypothetical protein BU14_0283s0012 [Porphyra umbilicalis]